MNPTPAIPKIELAENPTIDGVYFWWSNIFRTFRLSIWFAGDWRHIELSDSRELIERRAQVQSARFNLPVFEIEIPKWNAML